jgi:uncharacterized protein YbcI
MEAAISDAVIRFEKEFIGRGPLEIKSYILEDMIIIRLKGIFSNAEMKLMKSENSNRVKELIKQLRRELIESGRSILDSYIRAITKRKILSLHTDISATTGEKIIVLVMDKVIEIE